MLEGRRNQQQQKRMRPRVIEGYQSKVNLYNFVIFQNYDGTTTSKVIPREMYNKLFPSNV